jgi:hypothetical protein
LALFKNRYRQRIYKQFRLRAARRSYTGTRGHQTMLLTQQYYLAKESGIVLLVVFEFCFDLESEVSIDQVETQILC